MNVIIFGGTSAVASKVAYYFAINHDNVLISSRNFADGLALVNHLKLISGNQNINNFQFDALDYDYKKPMLSEMVKEYFEPDLVLIAYGTLTENKLIQNNLVKIRNELDINLFSIIGLCTEFASYFEQKKSGTIAVISSVAGDRARRSNYIYGTAKGAVSLYLQGLRGRLDSSGVKVITIKPGFIDTPMTYDLKKNFLYSSPDKIAKIIYKKLKLGQDIIYAPYFWKLIMLIIKIIPEKLFKKLNF